jgi:hypothetical protein
MPIKREDVAILLATAANTDNRPPLHHVAAEVATIRDVVPPVLSLMLREERI